MNRRSAALGLVVLSAYLAAAGLSFRGGLLPAAPVLDGLGPPPPYQWVTPPPDRIRDNKPPNPGTGTVPLPLTAAPSVSTPDGQAQLLFESTSVPPSPGQSSVSATLVPRDAATVGPPPAGESFYSNAYALEATYEPSGAALSTLSVTVALTYSSTAGQHVLRWNGSSWDPLPSTPVPASLLMYAPTTGLGTFVVAGPGGGTSLKAPSATRLVLEVAIPFVVILGVLGVVFGRRAVDRSRRGPGDSPAGGTTRR